MRRWRRHLAAGTTYVNNSRNFRKMLEALAFFVNLTLCPHVSQATFTSYLSLLRKKFGKKFLSGIRQSSRTRISKRKVRLTQIPQEVNAAHAREWCNVDISTVRIFSSLVMTCQWQLRATPGTSEAREYGSTWFPEVRGIELMFASAAAWTNRQVMEI